MTREWRLEGVRFFDASGARAITVVGPMLPHRHVLAFAQADIDGAWERYRVSGNIEIARLQDMETGDWIEPGVYAYESFEIVSLPAIDPGFRLSRRLPREVLISEHIARVTIREIESDYVEQARERRYGPAVI